MTGYDGLSPAQKAWVCRAARTVYLRCRGKRGAAASHSYAVRSACGRMPARMAGMVEALADSVRAGTLSLESLDTP